ncbi:MAG: hypothetical protein ABIK09_06390 [Pseudomonadota bacterium]
MWSSESLAGRRSALRRRGGVAGKRALCKGALLGLAAVFELASQYVIEMRSEIEDWDEGRRVTIGVLPSGPWITIEKSGDRIRYVGPNPGDASVSILFKNLDSAVLVFTGLLGAPWAVAENRVCVHGSNSEAIQVTRAMAIVQTYLFPGLILKKIFKRPPRLTAAQLANKVRILGLLTPTMIHLAGR